MKQTKGDMIKIRVSKEFKSRVETVAREMQLDVSTLTRSLLAQKIRDWSDGHSANKESATVGR